MTSCLGWPLTLQVYQKLRITTEFSEMGENEQLQIAIVMYRYFNQFWFIAYFENHIKKNPETTTIMGIVAACPGP